MSRPSDGCIEAAAAEQGALDNTALTDGAGENGQSGLQRMQEVGGKARVRFNGVDSSAEMRWQM